MKPDAYGFMEVPPAPVKIYQATKNDAFSTGVNGSWVDIPGLSLIITPNSPASLFLVRMVIQTGSDASATVTAVRTARNGTGIGVGDASGGKNSLGSFPYCFHPANMALGSTEVLDTPNTGAALIYTAQVQRFGGVSTVYINQDNSSTRWGFSTLTVIEVCL